MDPPRTQEGGAGLQGKPGTVAEARINKAVEIEWAGGIDGEQGLQEGGRPGDGEQAAQEGKGIL